MTKRDLLAVALKVLGLICLVYAFLDIASILIWFDMAAMPKDMMQPSRMILNAVLQILLITGLGIAFLGYADSITSRLVQDDVAVPAVEAGAWERPLLTLAARIIGLLLITFGLAELAGVVAERMQNTYGDVLHQWKWADWSKLAEGVLRVLTGGYLLSGAHDFLGWVCSLGSRRQHTHSVRKGGAKEDV